MMLRGRNNLYWGTLRIHGGRIREEMAARLISVVRDNAMASSNEFLRIRAGAVVVGGTALVLPSPPEPHLASLAGILVRSGAGYLGDEIAHIDPVLRKVHSASFPLLIDAEDLGHFAELGREPARPRRGTIPEFRRGTTPRRPVSVEELGGHQAEPVPLRWVVFPYFELGSSTRLEGMGGSEALLRFTEAGLNLHVWGERALILMRDLIESMPVSRLVVGSLPEAADLLLKHAPEMMAEARL
jgi:hypothetical protein